MENRCRTCLRSPKILISLQDKPDLQHKIETIAPIQLSDNEKLPLTICQECINNVSNFYNFRQVILNTDKDLRERLATLDRPVKVEVLNREPEPDQECEEQFKKLVKKTLASAKVYKCTICNKNFSSRFKLANHKKSEHTAPGVCNVCGAVIRADNLHKHVRTHYEKPIECRECGKTFKNTESLRGHSLIHKGWVFTCELCGKQSKIRGEHQRHLKSHYDPESRKQMCPICGKKVRDLKRHKYSHTGERPFICNYCEKGFISRYSLTVHIRQHTNEKPYVCDFCPMAYPQKVSLEAHLKSKHQQIS